MTACYDCGMPATAKGIERESLTALTKVPMRQNGWIGTNFIPWDKKWKRPKERKERLCGLCAATRYADELKGTDMESDELRDLLVDMAMNEVEARADHYKAMEKESAGTPEKTSRAKTRKSDNRLPQQRINDYLDRLIYTPKLTYAQKLSTWLAGDRTDPEPKPAGLSRKPANSVRTKLHQIFNIKAVTA